MITTMNLIGYLRVSTAKQVEQGGGLGVQRESIRTWAEAEGHAVTRVYQDEALSGGLSFDERPGLAAALDVISDKAAGGLVIAKLDRLARNLTVQEAILATVWKYGATVYTVDGGEVAKDDPDDPMRTAMRQMVGVFAQLERAMIGARMRAGRAAKAERGGYAYGSPPMGWRADAGELVREDGEQVAIARMVELRSAGLSLREVAAALDAEGLPPKRGGAWHSDVVRRILRRLV